MKNIVPNGDLPDNVQAVKFGASKEMKEEGIQDAFGIVHYPEHLTDPEKRYPGDVVAVEMMFEVSQEELMTLMHEPYITLTMLTDELPPTVVQTTHPYDPRYKLTVEHTHHCPECDKYYRCDNPKHKMPESRKLICDECWHVKMDEAVEQHEDVENAVDNPPEDEVSS